jgi:hypothetical protein
MSGKMRVVDIVKCTSRIAAGSVLICVIGLANLVSLELLDQPRFASWLPSFEDYLYLSFTNSTAFTLVGARAVNILA